MDGETRYHLNGIILLGFPFAVVRRVNESIFDCKGTIIDYTAGRISFENLFNIAGQDHSKTTGLYSLEVNETPSVDSAMRELRQSLGDHDRIVAAYFVGRRPTKSEKRETTVVIPTDLYRYLFCNNPRCAFVLLFRCVNSASSPFVSLGMFRLSR